MATFSEWIRYTRRHKDMTLEDCARIAGVSQPVWSKYEAGKSTPRRETVIKIAEALQENVDNALIMAGYLPKNKEYCSRIAELLEPILNDVPADKRVKIEEALQATARALASSA